MNNALKNLQSQLNEVAYVWHRAEQMVQEIRYFERHLTPIAVDAAKVAAAIKARLDALLQFIENPESDLKVLVEAKGAS